MRRVDRDQPSSITVTSRPSVAVVIGLTGPLWLGRNDRESDLSGIGHTGTGGGRRAEQLTVVTASDGLTVRCRRAGGAAAAVPERHWSCPLSVGTCACGPVEAHAVRALKVEPSTPQGPP